MTIDTKKMNNFWMPFTSSRDFKEKPRVLASAKGMYYTTDDGREILDGTAGLWCCHVGHGNQTIINAIAKQAAELDFAPPFQVAHPKSFELTARLADEVFPKGLDKIFLANSGSEAVDTALKIALGYHFHRGEEKRTLFIGRERGYHGVNFGGISVGGMPNNKKWFQNQLRTAHFRDTHDIDRNAFSRGLPEHGVEFADDLERVLKENDPATVAAVIIEPVAGSTGVLLPPKGYLERIREICDNHGILLIFDEVITAFGRLGAPTAAGRFNVTPDMITFAKGVNSGTVPLGGVAAKTEIYDQFVDGTPGKAVDFFHGYTYTAHPLAVAAAIATLDVYKESSLFTRGKDLEKVWEDSIHSLSDCPNVIDIRNLGLVGAVELKSREGAPATRAYDAFCDAFHNENILLRTTGDTIAMSPPLIVSEEEIKEMHARLRNVLERLS